MSMRQEIVSSLLDDPVISSLAYHYNDVEDYGVFDALEDELERSGYDPSLAGDLVILAGRRERQEEDLEL